MQGPINQEMVQRIFNSFSAGIQNKIETVHLLIQSGGGFVSDGVCIYNYLTNLPINIITYNVGNVSSIAVIVFLAGKTRIATEDATFMIHKTHISPNTTVTSTALKQISETLSIDNKRTESILKKYITMPRKKWSLHENGDLTINTKEALHFKLIHKISQFAPPPNAQLFNI